MNKWNNYLTMTRKDFEAFATVLRWHVPTQEAEKTCDCCRGYNILVEDIYDILAASNRCLSYKHFKAAVYPQRKGEEE